MPTSMYDPPPNTCSPTPIGLLRLRAESVKGLPADRDGEGHLLHQAVRWVRLQRQAASAGDTARVLDVDERAELERLRRENAELRLDRAFLKKVLMRPLGR